MPLKTGLKATEDRKTQEATGGNGRPRETTGETERQQETTEDNTGGAQIPNRTFTAAR